MKRILTTLAQKWPEYLIEGIVIISSILIAIGLENWNEERKDRQKEQKILVALKSEYQSNLLQLDQKTKMRNEMMEAAHGIFRYIDAPLTAERDSLMIFLFTAFRDPTYDPIQNDLISSGNIRLIQNDSLRLMLSNWGSDVYQLQELELDWQKVRTEIGANVMMDLGVARDLTHQLWINGYTPVEALDQTINIRRNVSPSKNPTPLDVILSSKELEGFISYVITWSQVANIQGRALRQRIEAILKHINQELKTE